MPSSMNIPEPGSATYRYHSDNSRPRPIRRSVSGPSPLSNTASRGNVSSMSGYGSTNSNRSQTSRSGGVSGGSDTDASRRDSHDLSVNGRVRDSLLDNLLLSFDKIGDGTFGNFQSPFFSNIDEVDDADSVFSRRTRSNSIGTSAPRQFEAAHDYGEGSFGVTYGERDTRSRGRGGISSSHGYANGYEPFESAPAPSIRTRNRTPSPPRSPRLVRRNSNKSIKSSRSRDQQFYAPQQPIALPPLPAFASPPPPATTAPPMSGSTKASRPGFFRRVFGGGGSSNSTATVSSISSRTSNTTVSAPVPSPQPQPQPPPPTATAAPEPQPAPPAVIKKKASFFGRRKKSVSDVGPPPPPVPVLPTAVPVPISVPSPLQPPMPMDDLGQPSPATSLRTAMNPYIRPPARPGTLESTREDREPGYNQRGATIRTVASSDPISPRRPSFFSESTRGRDIEPAGSGKKYQKETWSVGVEQHTPSKSPKDTFARPQSSPSSPNNSRTFFLDKDEDDDNWPPSPPSRGILSNGRSSAADFLSSGQERQDSVSSSSGRKPSISSLSQARKGSMVSLNAGRKSSVASNQTQIIDMKEIDRMYSDDEASASSTKGVFSLDPINLDLPRPKGGSWAEGPCPRTPTVTLQKEGHGGEAEVLGHSDEEMDNRLDDGLPEPSEEDVENARRIFEGDEEFVAKDLAAAWLGDGDPSRATALKAYMRLFDWSGCNILQSMRIFCGRIVFKGETQQVDRIMVAFAHRWCECNPNHGFKSSEIVHTILYSLLLLNTDLHIADIPNSQKMTKGQFIKNTMATIRRGIQEAAVEAEAREFRRQQNTGTTRSRRNTDDSQIFASTFPLPAGHKAKASFEFGRDQKGSRLSRIGNIGNLSPRILPEDHAEKADFAVDGGNALVNSAPGGGMRMWETQLEAVLKDFYHSVKSSALPLHGSSQEMIDPHQSNSLAVFGGTGMLRRSPSTISKAASEMSGVRGRSIDNNKLGTKWTAKNRSRGRVYNGSFAGSSRTSLEDRSVWSPSASSTWSKYTLDRTQTSMSVDSLGSAYTHAGDYQQSIGFANALSNAIIREEGASITSAEGVEIDPLDGDDTLELEGAPWAKEGMLKHKHHLESVDKRAKNRGWTECFAVIQRGYMRLFLFPNKSGKNSQIAGGVVGGGNWTENAEPIGSFLLRQTLASSLPPPGYSKTKPNVWALSLPSGAVHFFEVGTAEIVKEFVSTANYWSARLSKEPLIGGVSNVEYGWGDCLLDVDTSVNSPPPSVYNEAGPHSRTSLQMSIRSSIDHGTVRPKLPGDKINIKDWVPPSQSMVASNLSEKDQLKALQNYVANIEAELAKHNELRHAMQLAFTPKHPNSAKAHANWEKKSSYLLREIIKFTTYIETLDAAIQRREKVNQERLSWITAKNQPPPTIEADDLDITPRADKGKSLDLEGVLTSGF